MAFLSQHIGDLAHPEALDMLRSSLEHLLSLLTKERPALLVHDLHPHYHSTFFAESQRELPRLAIQHHQAHALACLADNGWEGPALALTLDGTGYGTDGHVWGGELLWLDGLTFRRLGHLKYLPLPGGDLAAKQPWRMALTALVDALGPAALKELRHLPPLGAAPQAIIEGVIQLAARGSSLPLTSSTGRIFDAVASLLNLRQVNTFEGQAAMELEHLAQKNTSCEAWSYRIEEHQRPLRLDLAPLFADILDALRQQRERAAIARIFHQTLALALAELTARANRHLSQPLKTVALSGGVLQNRLFASLLTAALQDRGFQVLGHHRVPANDGGLALGQAWAGLLYLQS
jgi:hydrogenase maturation protein HypF